MNLRLTELRHKHPQKLRQRDVADYLGMGFSSYRRLEKGERKQISFNELEMLCSLFQCTPNDLFDETTSNKEEKELIAV